MKLPLFAIAAILAVGLSYPLLARADSLEVGAPIVALMPHLQKLAGELNVSAEQQATPHTWQAKARTRRVIVLCRSGNRSVLAAHTLAQMGLGGVASLGTRLRGWNDYEQPLQDDSGRCCDPDKVDELFRSKVLPEQLGPASRAA